MQHMRGLSVSGALTRMLLAGAVLAVGEVAPKLQAQDTHGWYLTVSGSPVQSRKRSDDLFLNTAATFQNGFAVNAGTGYRFPLNIRAEAELSYQNNKNSAFFVDLANQITEPSTGSISLRSFMANGYYDVPLHDRLRPYVGFGVGAYQSCINGVTTRTLHAGIPGVFPPTVLSICSYDTFAWQFRTGASVRITERTEFFSGFRYFRGDTLQFNVPGFMQFSPTGEAGGGVVVTGGVTKHFELGFRANLF